MDAALHWAALCAEGDGAVGGLKLLFEHAPDAAKGLVNGQSSSASTPLHCALTRGHEDAVRLLVQNGADIKVKDEDGKTAENLAKEHSKLMLNIVKGKK